MNKSGTDPFSQEEEKQDFEDLKKLTDVESFQNIIKEHPKLEAFFRKIRLVIQQYDDLSKVEEEKAEMEANAENSEEKTNEENDKSLKKEQQKEGGDK